MPEAINDRTQTFSDNQRSILDLVRVHGALDRSALPERTMLSQQSVHRIVTGLHAEGLLTVTAPAKNLPGKPSPSLSLNADHACSVGILINTDGVVLTVVDLACTPRAERRLVMDLGDRHACYDIIHAEYLALLSEAGMVPEKVCGIGLTFPGYFVQDARHLNSPEPLRDWSLVDVAAEMEARFDKPVSLIRSAIAGAVGENLNGVGKIHRNFAYLGFDHGFGGAIVLDGKAIAGHFGNAGELSTVFVNGESQHRPALRLLLDHLKERGTPVANLFELKDTFDPDWPGVAEWIDIVMPQVNRVVLALHGFVDPEAIVFGGRIPRRLAEMLIERVEFPTRARYDVPLPRPRLMTSQAIGDPAALGAALTPLKSTFF